MANTVTYSMPWSGQGRSMRRRSGWLLRVGARASRMGLLRLWRVSGEWKRCCSILYEFPFSELQLRCPGSNLFSECAPFTPCAPLYYPGPAQIKPYSALT